MKLSRFVWLSVIAASIGILLAGGVAGAAEKAAAPDDEIEALMRQAAADDARNAAAQAPSSAPGGTLSGLRGFAQLELARAYESPAHWSKMLGRVECLGQAWPKPAQGPLAGKLLDGG